MPTPSAKDSLAVNPVCTVCGSDRAAPFDPSQDGDYLATFKSNGCDWICYTCTERKKIGEDNICTAAHGGFRRRAMSACTSVSRR